MISIIIATEYVRNNSVAVILREGKVRICKLTDILIKQVDTMKLDHSVEHIEELKPAFDLIAYQKQYEGTLIGNYVSYFLKRNRSDEEEKALYYGIQAMVGTKREKNNAPKGEVVDLNRTLQALKMQRKGFQNQMNKKEEKWMQEEARIQERIALLQDEKLELQKRREAVLEKTIVQNMHQGFGKDKDLRVSGEAISLEDARTQKFRQNKQLLQGTGAVLLILFLAAMIFWIPFPWNLLLLLTLGIAETGILYAIRKQEEELNQYKKKKIRRIKKQEALLNNLEEIDERIRLKEQRQEEEQRKYDAFLQRIQQKQPEEVEMDALTLAIDTISWMTAF